MAKLLLSVVPPIDPRDKELPEMRFTSGMLFPYLGLVELPIELLHGSQQLFQLRKSISHAIYPFFVRASDGDGDCKDETQNKVLLQSSEMKVEEFENTTTRYPELQSFKLVSRLIGSQDYIDSLRSHLVSKIPGATRLEGDEWQISTTTFYLQSQGMKAMKKMINRNWGFQLQFLQLMLIPESKDDVFGYERIGNPIPCFRKLGINDEEMEKMEEMKNKKSRTWKNPFDALLEIGEDMNEDVEKDDFNAEHRAFEADLARRAMKIPPQKKQNELTRTAKQRMRKNASKQRANQAESERIAKENEFALNARQAGLIPNEDGPWCRETNVILQHMKAEPHDQENLRHTKEMVKNAKRKTDECALEELVKSGFLTIAQKNAALQLFASESMLMIPLTDKKAQRKSKKKKKTNRNRVIEAFEEEKIPKGQSEVERLRDLLNIGFITEKEFNKRKLEVETEESIRNRRVELENGWFELELHQSGPLAEILLKTKPRFDMVGPLAASLIAGSDAGRFCRGTKDLPMIGENPLRRKEDAENLGPLTPEQQVVAIMKEAQIKEMEKVLPSIANQYRALVRIEKRMRKLYCYTLQKDLLLPTH